MLQACHQVILQACHQVMLQAYHQVMLQSCRQQVCTILAYSRLAMLLLLYVQPVCLRREFHQLASRSRLACPRLV